MMAPVGEQNQNVIQNPGRLKTKKAVSEEDTACTKNLLIY